MEIRLRPMSIEELAAYRGGMVDGYAQAMMRDGGLREDEARAKAAADIASAWPGSSPPDGHVAAIVEAGGEAVGRVWFAPHATRPALFLNDVEIDEAHRGRGLGRAALALLEDEARARGLSAIELNVWGGNERARSLYRSAGYAEVAVSMRKLL
jgi:ribosomal protein S18 acetylase RimI-like enzyme